MRRPLLYTLCGLITYALTLLWLLPAERWFGVWQSYAPQWSASHLDGNIFSGSVRQLRMAQHRIGALQWQWQASSLLRGKLGYHWQLSDAEVQLEGVIMLNLSAPLTAPLQLAKLQGELPLSRLLDGLGAALPGVTALLQTDLSLQIDPSQAHVLSADGLILIKQLQMTHTNTLDLGEFQVQLNTESGQIQGLAQDRNSPLELQARLHAQTNGHYQLQGEVAARAQADEAIRALLSLLGTSRADGKRPFNIQGQFF